jgi:hypothetical protein
MRRLRIGADVLALEMPSPWAPVEVAEPVAVHLWVSFATLDTDFMAKGTTAY